MANISFTDSQSRHSDARSTTCQHEFQTEADCGFNLHSAYKSRDSQLDHLVVVASLIASVAVMAVLGFEIFWRAV